MRVCPLSRTVTLVLLVAVAGFLAPVRIAAQDLEDLPDPNDAAAACWPDEEPDTSDGFPQWSEPPVMIVDDSGETAYTATFETSEGEFTVDLLPEEAPATVNNFVCLALAGFYDGTTFHRVVPEFVIQGGDPTGTGRGGPGYQFDDEPIERDYETGTLAMANAGPDTNGSQFFVVLDGGAGKLAPDYTIFGQVADEASQEVVETIGESDPEEQAVEIESILIEEDKGDERDGEPGGEASGRNGAETDEGNEGDTGENARVQGDDYEGVIFSEENAPDLVAGLDGPDAAEVLEYWTPDEDDVEALEDGIEDYLDTAADDGDVESDLVDRLPDYVRQYAGIVEDGEELILANFFCDDVGIDWESVPVVVEDGGDCFFRVTYDVEREGFSDLEVNGEA